MKSSPSSTRPGFLLNKDKHELTILNKYNYEDARLEGLIWDTVVSILVGHILYLTRIANLLRKPIPM